MRRSFYQKQSRMAYVSRWIGVFCANLLLLTILLHRFADLSTPAAVNLIALAFLGGGIALILSVLALVRIWITGQQGAVQAVIGIIVGVLMFALPAWYLPKLISLPQINDISTDRKSPPKFQTIARSRTTGANPSCYSGEAFASTQERSYDISTDRKSPPKFQTIARSRTTGANPGSYSGEAFASTQERSYPDIVPFTLERSYDVAFEIAKQAAERLGWEIIAQKPPRRPGQNGYLEAVDKTLIFGFKDDIVVRVAGNDKSSRIDVRSASRYGRHDLGRNAERIRQFFNAIKTDLDQFERAYAERKAREEKERAKARELARKRRLEKARRARSRRARVRRGRSRGRKRKKRRRRKQQWTPF